QAVSVYYRIGGDSGYETNPGARTLHDSGTMSGNAGSHALINMGSPHNLDAGVTYGIDLNYNSQYTNTSTTTYSNSDLTLQAGVGLCSAFGGTNTPRVYNGTIYYRANCEGPRVPV